MNSPPGTIDAPGIDKKIFWLIVFFRVGSIACLVAITIFALLENIDQLYTAIRAIKADRLLHIAAVYLLSLTVIAGAPGWPRWRLFMLVFMFGLCLEMIQPSFGRELSVFDLAADVVGILLVALPSYVTDLRLVFRNRPSDDGNGV